jgi:hypothetical protein
MRCPEVPLHQALRRRRGRPPPDAPKCEPPSRSNKPAATSRVAGERSLRDAQLLAGEDLVRIVEDVAIGVEDGPETIRIAVELLRD